MAEKSGPLLLVPVFNGAEGDISPNWHQQDRRNTLRLGLLLAGHIIKTSNDAATPVDGNIRGCYDRIGLRNRQVTDTWGKVAFVAEADRSQTLMSHWTDEFPSIGVAAVGGAEDGRTTYYDLGSIEGVTDWRRPNRGSKEVEMRLSTVARPYNKIINTLGKLRPEDAPTTAPLGVYMIGPIVIATIPGEATTVLGRRIAQRLLQTTKLNHAIIIGLANEYISYFTTPEEYDMQHYEGAFTLYGPASGPLLEAGWNDWR